MVIKLNLGVGPRPFHAQHSPYINSEWTLCDKHIQAPGIKNLDARDLSEYEDNTVSEIYNSHLLEHFSFEESVSALKEWFRVLVPGGKLTLNVPDMEYAACQILEMSMGVKVEHPTGGIKSAVFTDLHKIMEIIYGNQDHEGEYHKSGYTKKSLEEKLRSVGFVDVIANQVYDAHDMGVLIAVAYKPLWKTLQQ